MSIKDDIDKLMEKGYEKYQLGEYLKALNFFSQALKVAKKNKAKLEECLAIKMEATALYRLAEYKRSEEKYLMSLKIAQKLGDEKQEARIYNHLIALYEMINDYQRAKEYIKIGYDLAKRAKDDYTLAKILTSWGVYHHIFGDNDKAQEKYEEALEIFEKLEDSRNIGTVLNLIAGIQYDSKQLDEALDSYQRVKQIGENLPDNNLMAMASCRIGYIYYDTNNNDKALDLLKDPVFLEEKSENKKLLIEVYYVRALLLKNLGDFKGSTENFERSISLAKKLDTKYFLAKVEKEFGFLFFEEGLIDDALFHLEECIKLFEYLENNIIDEELKKQFRGSFQDIPEIILGLTGILQYIQSIDVDSKIEKIHDSILKLCKLTDAESKNQTTKILTKILAVQFHKNYKKLEREKEIQKNTILKQRDELLIKYQELEEENKKLKQDLLELQNQFDQYINDPSSYDQIPTNILKQVVHTNFWKFNEEKIKNNFLKDHFKKLDDHSKDELILMKTIQTMLDTGYKTCAFLLTKIIERELRVKIFLKFKEHWKTNLNEKKFLTKIKPGTYEHVKNTTKITDEILLNYLQDKKSLTLGNINKIIIQIGFYCRNDVNSYVILGWEIEFKNLFKDFCQVANKIIDAFKQPIPSKGESTAFIELRNLVTHPDEIEESMEDFKDIVFDAEFIDFLFDFLISKNPMLLKVICEIETN